MGGWIKKKKRKEAKKEGRKKSGKWVSWGEISRKREIPWEDVSGDRQPGLGCGERRMASLTHCLCRTLCFPICASGMGLTASLLKGNKQ